MWTEYSNYREVVQNGVVAGRGQGKKFEFHSKFNREPVKVFQ